MNDRICEIENCDSILIAKNMCRRHYYQVKKRGKIYATVYDKRPAIIEGEFAKIPLGVEAKDGYAIVDKKFANLAEYFWCKGNNGYAHGIVGELGDVLLHRYIMNFPSLQVDHKDRDKLNNRSENLRACTPSQNIGNKLKPSTNSTGFKGVKWHIKNRKWIARIGGKHIGSYESKMEAANAYDEEAIRKWGEYACLNNFGS